MEKVQRGENKWHARCFSYVPQESTKVEDIEMAGQKDRAGYNDSGTEDRNSGNRGDSSNMGDSSDSGMRGSPGRGSDSGSDRGSSGGSKGESGVIPLLPAVRARPAGTAARTAADIKHLSHEKGAFERGRLFCDYPVAAIASVFASIFWIFLMSRALGECIAS